MIINKNCSKYKKFQQKKNKFNADILPHKNAKRSNITVSDKVQKTAFNDH